jgi:hypothetical protein
VTEQGDALLQGTPPSSADPDLFPAILSYLRDQKAVFLKPPRPDYPKAQQCHDVCSALMLLMGQADYCGEKQDTVHRLEEKIDQAKAELEKVLNEREHCSAIFDRRRQRSIAKLQNQQQRELQAHDEHYGGGLPMSHRHASAEVLQLREQERALRRSRRFLEAQSILEEAEALEAFEIETLKIRWQNEGRAAREQILQRHTQQMQCLLEKAEQTWEALMPDSIARENHWKRLIATLERKIGEERGASAEVERTTRGILANSREALPPLGAGGIPTPMRRAAFSNSTRAYSVCRVHRAHALGRRQ